MKNKIIALIASFGLSFTFLNAQQSLVDKVKFEPGTILVGMASEYNSDNEFDKYNFFVDDATRFNEAKLNLEYGYELSSKVTDQNHFMIYAIKDRKIIDQWLVNPRIYNVFHNGIAYSFNADQLQVLAEKNPLNIEIIKKTFANEKDFNRYKKEIQNDRSIFLVYEPNFTYEGYFEVEFQKNEEINEPIQAEDYLRNLVKGITKKNVNISYALNEKNLTNPKQITMIVFGTEELYKKIKLEKGVKGGWNPDVYEAVMVKKK